MKRLLLLIAIVFMSPLASGQRALDAARRATELLGPEVWSRVLRIDHGGGSRHAARAVYATVFELGGLLWLYEPESGTQSLSLCRGNLEEEKTHLLRLLRAIEPGFAAFVVLPSAQSGFEPRAELPNGCFIESYAAWRERRCAGDLLLEARLLSYYVSRSGRLLGHTVLTYATAEGVFVLDPATRDRKPHRLDGVALNDAAAVAAALRADLSIAKARWIPADLVRPAAPSAGGSPLRHAHADKAG